MTEPEEKAERYQLMQQFGISELDAAFKVAEKSTGRAASTLCLWTHWTKPGSGWRLPAGTVCQTSSISSGAAGLSSDTLPISDRAITSSACMGYASR